MKKLNARGVVKSLGKRALRHFRVVAACALVTLGGCALVEGVNIASASSSPPLTSTADCHSVTTCYTPKQIQVAYGVEPLLRRGVDGRGETVVLPELAYPLGRLPVRDR